MRVGVIAVVSLCSACLSFPTIAAAGRIELRPGQVIGTTEFVYTGAPGEANHPLLQRHMAWYVLQDIEGPPTERVPPCDPNPEPGGLGVSSRCPGNSVASAVIDLGDRDDFGSVDQNTVLFIPVTVFGGPGRDRISMHSFEGNLLDGGPGDDVIASEVLSPTLTPGPGDTVVGGEGDDEISTQNDRRDLVQCGSGFDVVTADELDDVAADCETVHLPADSAWVRADGKPIGMTINNGAVFTRTTHVRLTVRAPDSATHLRISNDGGFDTSLRVPRKKNEKYRFELPSSGLERLPKIVYVRFDGPGLDPNRTVTDDIVLDQTPPRVDLARALRHTGSGFRIALQARDATSGVKTAQFARVRSTPWAPVRYRSRITVRRAPRWARVRDGARNATRWRRIGR